MGDIFDMFGGGGGSRRRQRGEDLQILVEVSFAESYTGVSKKIVFNRHAACPTCHGDGAKPGTKKETCKKCSGKGRISTTKKTIFGVVNQQSTCPDCEGSGKMAQEKCTDCKGAGFKMKKEEISIPVPEGVEDGEQLVLRGYGEFENGAAGDLYVVVRVTPNKAYIRKGLNLYSKVDLKLTDIILGKMVTIKDPLGKDLEIQVPSMQNPKEQIVVHKKGFKRQGRTGDLILDVNLTVPKHLSKSSKDLLDKLRAEGL
jgi:molecular chaperone DnaJ